MVALLLLLSLQSSQAPTRWPIESIAIEGIEIYSREDILGFTGLTVGQTAGKEELEAARERLAQTGYFANAGFRFSPGPSRQGIAVTFEIAELSETYPIRFERLAASAGELTAHLKASDPLFRDWIPASPAILERCSRAIESFLAGRNQKVAVSGKLWPDRTGNLAVLFSPAARAPAIAQVQFTGSSVLSAGQLQTAIAPVAIGAAYTDDGFEEMLGASVRKLYESKGLLRVAFPKVTVSPAEGIDGVAVLVEVVEGGAYTLGEVEVEAGGLPEAELLKAADIKTGETVNIDEVQAGVERLNRRLHASGYLKPESRVERLFQDADRKVNLVIHVAPGPRYSFGRLTVRGLDLDGEAQIRRLWAMKPGEPFNPTYADFFLSRIREDGLFDNLGATKASVAIDEDTHTAAVTLDFAAAPVPPKEPPRRRRSW